MQELPPQPAQGLNPRDPALLAELPVTPDVPLALVQYCSPTLLVVSSNQLCALNKFIVTPGKPLDPYLMMESSLVLRYLWRADYSGAGP